MTGAALSAPLIMSLQSCKTDAISKTDIKKLHFFKKDQMRLVQTLADTILPKTDSPSASEVGVPNLIDQMVGEVYDTKDQTSYAANFEKLSAYLQQQANGKDFHKLTEAERVDILNRLSKTEDEALSEASNGYLTIKQQTIAYYLSTEEIGTKYLNYLPVPGPYEGCISLESVGGKAWAI